MLNHDKLPVREFKITDDNGKEFGNLDAISIVTDPAIESSFQLFNKQRIQHFTSTPIANEKMQITGAVMIPNKKMLRQDPNNGEYFMGWFSEDTIARCAKNYLRRKKHTQANLEHSEDFSSDFYIMESWLVEDPANDKSNALGFKDITKGTWFVTYQVKNRETWNKIKDGSYKGFSVEVEAALFNTINELQEDQEQDDVQKIKDIVFNSTLTDADKERLIKTIIK